MECRNCDSLKNCKHQCMQLPDGYTCADCIHVDWCTLVYGTKPDNTMCGWEPIRFAKKGDRG